MTQLADRQLKETRRGVGSLHEGDRFVDQVDYTLMVYTTPSSTAPDSDPTQSKPLEVMEGYLRVPGKPYAELFGEYTLTLDKSERHRITAGSWNAGGRRVNSFTELD